jgi:hypothetical protein
LKKNGIVTLFDILKGASNNQQRHSELVSESPVYVEIAGHARNDMDGINGIIRSPQ